MRTTSSKSVSAQTGSEEMALKMLFLDELKELYWTEIHFAITLPDLIGGSASASVCIHADRQFQETLVQIMRLEAVFQNMGEEAAGKFSPTSEYCLHRAKQMAGKDEVGTISAIQEIMHLKIAAYETLRTLAVALDYQQIVVLMAETLVEIRLTDTMLIRLTESFTNQSINV